MEAFVNRTLKAYFTEGKNINDQDVLLGLAEDVDLDKEESIQVLESDRFKDQVVQISRQLRKLVPKVFRFSYLTISMAYQEHNLVRHS